MTRRAHQIGLDEQIIFEKIDWISIIGENISDFGGGDNHNLRPLRRHLGVDMVLAA